MTKTQAIKKHCFDCAGESNKEVSLCTAYDCDLWIFRTGARAGTKGYLSRMATAKKNYEAEFKEWERGLADYCITSRSSRSPSSKQRSVEKKNG